jgi:hypothetical protein
MEKLKIDRLDELHKAVYSGANLYRYLRKKMI